MNSGTRILKTIDDLIKSISDSKHDHEAVDNSKINANAASHNAKLNSPNPWISTHILDTAHGVPAKGVRVELRYTSSVDKAISLSFDHLTAYGYTGETGRIARNWIADGNCIGIRGDGAQQIGFYQLKFFVREYFAARSETSFWPVATVEFEVTKTDIECAQHFHVPLLLSNYGLSTYKGS